MCALEQKEPAKELQREFEPQGIEQRLTAFMQELRTAPVPALQREAHRMATSMTNMANALERGRSEDEDRYIGTLETFARELRETAEYTTGLNRGNLETAIISGHRLLAQFRSWARDNRRPGGMMAWPETDDFRPRIGGIDTNPAPPDSTGLQREF